jgi:hypothetical protein
MIEGKYLYMSKNEKKSTEWIYTVCTEWSNYLDFFYTSDLEKKENTEVEMDPNLEPTQF